MNVMCQTSFVIRTREQGEIFRTIQNIPKQYKNVKIYASKYFPSNAIIRNLSFTSEALVGESGKCKVNTNIILSCSFPVVSPLPSPPSRCPLVAMNFQDLVDMKNYPNIKSWRNCAGLCWSDPDCNVWSWNHGGSAVFPFYCRTSFDYGYLGNDTNVVSAFKNCTGLISNFQPNFANLLAEPTTCAPPPPPCALVGKNFLGLVDMKSHADVKSWSACSEKCASDPKCNHWSWNQDDSTFWPYFCRTFKSFQTIGIDKNVISGDKYC